MTSNLHHGRHFDPVVLPSCPPGGPDPARLVSEIDSWVTSAPMRELAQLSGWAWPDAPDVRGVVGALVQLSDDWDFRRQRERNFIESGPAHVSGRELPEQVVVEAAEALGLVTAVPPAGRFDHVVVLSGLVRACLNRIHYGAEMIASGVDVTSVSVLTAHRRLGGAEPEQAAALGLGDVDDEAEVVERIVRATWGLGAADERDESRPPNGDARSYLDWSVQRWKARAPASVIEIVVAPSLEPERRANTSEQLRFWADRSGVAAPEQVLLVTTQIYVPFQHLEAIRELGLERGIGLTTVGVDPGCADVPMRDFTGVDYLQEVRSALQSASRLLEKLGGST